MNARDEAQNALFAKISELVEQMGNYPVGDQVGAVKQLALAYRYLSGSEPELTEQD